MVFIALGVGNAGINLRVGGGLRAGGIGDDVLELADGFAPEALLGVEPPLEQDSLIGGDAGDVTHGAGLEDKLVDGTVRGLELGVGGGGADAQALDSVEEGWARHLNTDDIRNGNADLRGARAAGRFAFYPEDVFVALIERGLEGGLLGDDRIGAELRMHRERRQRKEKDEG